MALATRCDGVILALESERSRWRVARRLRVDIETRGGRVIGGILCNRRYRIPRFLYDRL